MSVYSLQTAPRRAGSTTTARDDRAAVDKAMALLASFELDELDEGLGVSELARRSNLSKSTAFRILGILERNGAVERIGSAYRLGHQMHNIGAQVYPAEHLRIRDLLTPFLADLYIATGQTVHLAVLRGSDVLYLNKLYGHRHLPSPSRIGGRAPAHCTAVGKALLAHVDAFRPEEIDLEIRTKNTVSDSSSLGRELMDVRRTGIAFDREEVLLGLNCVGAVVSAGLGKPVAAMSVSGSASSLDLSAHTHILRRVCSAASRAMSTHRIGRPEAG